MAALALLAATTWQRATLWADQPRMAGLWAAANPGSSRAIATQALFHMQARRPDLAMAVLSLPWQRRPHDLQLAFNYIDAACMARGPSGPDTRAVERALRNNLEGGPLVFDWLNDKLDAVRAGTCRGVSLDNVERWARAALENPRASRMPGRRQDLHSILGRVALARGDATAALGEFRAALDASPTPDAAAQQSALLASRGHPGAGLSLLDHYAALESRREPPAGWNMPRLHQWVLQRQRYWPNEFARLRREMRADLAAKEATP